MNNKHIALLIVGIFAFCLVQLTLWVRDKAVAEEKKVSAKVAEETSKNQQLQIERRQLSTMTQSSEGLLRFLEAWQPYFDSVGSAQSAEAAFTLKAKEGNLLSISQRFEKAPVPDNPSLPGALRVHITFEDKYAPLLNWLGGVEKDYPTLRVTSLRMFRGTRAGDLRMELSMDQPILAK